MPSSSASETLIGRDCDVFLLANGGTTRAADLVYWLDSTTSLPLKVVFYRNPAERAANRPYFEWTATQLGKVQGYPYVKEATQLNYTEDGTLIGTQQIHTRSVAFNKEFPISTFRLEKSPHAPLPESVASHPVPPAPSSSANASPPKPIRATPPRRWGSITAPLSLGLGAVLLTASLFLLWRRR